MSQPFWWGDWRPNLTPHTGNLQPTDLIECTSMLGGVPTNTAITGAQIIAAASGGSATWGGITGTLSAQTDLQSALDNKVPYTGATADVNLGSHDLTATQGTFDTGGSSDTLTVNHTSGSGNAITITKGGSGEGIYVNKTSGSGNAVTIVGDLEATTIKKSSGTSTQFLKADGSVDTTTYQPTLVSGTNIKTVNGNSLVGSGNVSINGITSIGSSVGATVSGTTTGTISGSVLIPAGTISEGQNLMIRVKIRKISGTGTCIARLGINTSNTTTGSLQIGQSPTLSNNTFTHIMRDPHYTTLALYTIPVGAANFSDYTSQTTAAISFNPAVDNYLFVALYNSTTLDVTKVLKLSVLKYD